MKLIRILLGITLFQPTRYVLAQIMSVTERRVTSPDGINDEVLNQASVPIVAFDAQYRCNGRKALGYTFDTVINYGSNSPIGPGRKFAFEIPKNIQACDGGVDAVLFADGHSEGDQPALKAILEKRKGALSELEAVINLIEPKSSIYLPDLLAKQLEEKANAVMADSDLTVPERKGRIYMLSVLAGLLKRRHVIDTPSDHTPAAKPSVSSLMSSQHIPLEMAHAIVLKEHLQEWANDLRLGIALTNTK